MRTIRDIVGHFTLVAVTMALFSACNKPNTNVPTLDLSGNWERSQDANQNSPAPLMDLVQVAPDSVEVGYHGVDGETCDCNSFHLVIPLNKTMQCSESTLEFEYHTQPNSSFGYTSTASVSVRFCTGSCPTDGFYTGPQFLGSEQIGHSNCAFLPNMNNNFPVPPQLHEGLNVIPLGSLQADINGSCDGTFDTIDVHLQGYGCYEKTDHARFTLANLRIY